MIIITFCQTKKISAINKLYTRLVISQQHEISYNKKMKKRNHLIDFFFIYFFKKKNYRYKIGSSYLSIYSIMHNVTIQVQWNFGVLYTQQQKCKNATAGGAVIQQWVPRAALLLFFNKEKDKKKYTLTIFIIFQK